MKRICVDCWRITTEKRCCSEETFTKRQLEKQIQYYEKLNDYKMVDLLIKRLTTLCMDRRKK